MAEPFIQRAHKQIQIESWSNSAREILLRGYSEDGPFAESHTTNADRSRAVDTYEVHGDPISITARPAAVPVRRGECYVRLTLVLDGEPVKRFFSAYLTDGKTLAWPPGVFEGFTEGAGLIRTITGTNPAAGAEVSEAVPTNARWRLIAIKLNFTTDGTVANRYVSLTTDDGAVMPFQIYAQPAHAASVGKTYTFSPAAADRAAALINTINTPIPPELILPQASRIRSLTNSIQAGDDHAAPLLTVEEWIEE